MSAFFKKLRSECAKRAGGICELPDCGAWIGENGELAHADHFWGRGAGRDSETLETVWLLCPDHDHQKTNNKPDAAYWLCAFIKHCGKYGYDNERAESRLQFVTTRAAV